MSRILGIDIGGSGSRVALESRESASGAGRLELEGGRIGVTEAGSTAPQAVLSLLRQAAEAWPEQIAEVSGVGVGATGLGTLVSDPAALARDLESQMHRITGREDVGVAIAIDAVTAHMGALDGGSGAIVALGTGAIALGTDGKDIWRRVDGWGHLLGDRGGGAWIGLRGLEAAIRAHDGIDLIGSALLDRARRRFGDPVSWPKQFYTRIDRAGVIAAFAADVARLADENDPVATEIMAGAGREAARSVVAALDPALEPVIAATGGVFRAGGALVRTFEKTIGELRPDARLRAPAGDPLHGAIILAERAAAGTLSTQVPFLWVTGRIFAG